MSLPNYRNYKDSDAKWVGWIPAHWVVGPLKRMLDIQNGADHKNVESTEGFPVIGSGGPFTFASKFLYDGEAVLLGRKGTIDKPLHVIGKFWTVDTMYWSKILPGTCGRFAYYVTLTIPFDYYSTSTALPSMTKSVLGAHLVACPPIDEQTAIAAFLDRETAKIDALITEQEKLIVLLAEKRQATISHAVTKGINPITPMKDSGVAWLRDIPAHWGVTRLKYATDAVVDCPHETPVYEEGGPYRVIRTADVSEGKLHLGQMYTVAQQEFLRRITRMPLEQNDIVYSREGARWGFAAQVPASNAFCLGQRMMQFRAVAGIDPRFLMWQLNAQSTYQQGQMDTVGAASPHVNVGTIKNYILSHPPIGEQEEISKFLDTETSKLDKLDAEVVRTISLLRQRRSTLIAAAVTGQIDVRSAIPRAAVESPEAIAA